MPPRDGVRPGLWWCFALGVALLAAASCSRAPSAAAPAVDRLIDDSFSETRLTYDHVHYDAHAIDFTSMSTLAGLRVVGADFELRPDGLLLRPAASVPILVFDDIAGHSNFIRVEMASSVDGILQVYWRSGEAPFDPIRTRRIRVTVCEDVRTWDIDLSKELGSKPSGYRFRIDWIDQQAEVRIRTITFSRAVATPAGADPLRVGKVTIGREVREALMLRAHARFRKTIRGGAGAKLVFGLARSRGNEVPVMFRITLGSAGRERILFEENLGTAGEVAWLDREVDLPDCPRQGCELTLEGGAQTPSDVPPALFVSNPVVVGGREPKAPNVILVSLDTLGGRHLSSLGAPAGTSPHLDDRGRRGVVFENCFANSSATHSSHGSLLTGSAPFETGYYWLDGVVDQEVTLADTLRHRGYLTAAFTGGVLVSERFGLDKGFETFYQHDTLYRPPAEHSDVEPITARALAWVERHAGGPFFLFVHTYEVHGPYVTRESSGRAANRSTAEPLRYLDALHMRGKLPSPPSELPQLVQTLSATGQEISLAEAGIPLADAAVLREAYRSEIRFLDRALERFLDALGERGVLDDAIVVLTSDHGEAFFEHGLLEHGLLYDENLRIPLVFWGPGRLPRGKRVPQHVSSSDVAPTILDLVGLPIPPDMEGRSLVPLIDGRDDAERDFYSLTLGNGLSFQAGGRYKLILRAALEQENFGKNELFDLAEDPLEQRNLLSDRVEIPPRLERALRQTIEQFPGIHIDLGALAGRRYELELAIGQDYHNRIYAFDVERIRREAEEDPKTLRCPVTFSDRSRLIIRNRIKGSGAVLLLHPPDGGETLSFLLEPPDASGERRKVPARRSGDGVTLSVWRVDKTAISAAGLSPEEEEKLRTLGYL